MRVQSLMPRYAYYDLLRQLAAQIENLCPPKSAPSRGGINVPTSRMAPWTHRSPDPKRHFAFIRLTVVTNRQADTQTTLLL